MAIQRQRSAVRPIHDSDRRVKYASHDHREALSAAGITASTSRKAADCFDDGPMESFFYTLKTELVHHRHYEIRAEAQHDIAFIEGFYNRTRLHWPGMGKCASRMCKHLAWFATRRS
jgi:transposase InsO family protein